jgi:hypothetical protein
VSGGVHPDPGAQGRADRCAALHDDPVDRRRRRRPDLAGGVPAGEAEITRGPVQELGETLADYYFRLTVRLGAPSGRHERFNRLVILADAVRLPSAVRYAAFLVR